MHCTPHTPADMFTTLCCAVLCPADFKAEAISAETKVLNESGKEMPLPKK